jgi:hypothetical protein
MSTLEAFARVVAALDQFAIPYLVGGPVASSAHGIARPTMDADLVVDLRPEPVDSFVNALGQDFYADPDDIRNALRRGSSANLIHIPMGFKIDLFPLGRDAYSQQSFNRRRQLPANSFGPQPVTCSIATPEDTILRKLEWYRQGGETSERQWNDLRGILQIRGDELDLSYLREWAPTLKVADLLERLLAEFNLGAAD